MRGCHAGRVPGVPAFAGHFADASHNSKRTPLFIAEMHALPGRQKRGTGGTLGVVGKGAVTGTTRQSVQILEVSAGQRDSTVACLLVQIARLGTVLGHALAELI